MLVSIIVLVALIGFSLKEREELTLPEKFLKDTTGWFMNAIGKPVSAVTGFLADISDLQNTFEENKKLKERLDEYVLLKTEVQDLKQENKELREILDKKDDLREFTPIQATVIGRNPSRWNELLTINRGEIHGVEKDMAVITAKGLIGRVKSVTNFTASVQLISSTDATNRVSAIIQNKGGENIFGIIEGVDEETNHIIMKRIPYDKEVKKGSYVITSNLGGIFPKGLPIGKVVDVKVDQFGLNQKAYIEPATDFYNISNVMVVNRTVDGADEVKTEEDEE